MGSFQIAFIDFARDHLVPIGINLLFPTMLLFFVGGIVFRSLIFYTVKRHDWFAREFEKRVTRYLEGEVPGEKKNVSFYVLSKKMLERTYYEIFENRDKYKRRTPDSIMSLSDRVFLVKQGTAWLVRDILRQIKFLKWGENQPKLLHITKATLQHNPCFNSIFGVIPAAGVNDILNILPGLFVIGGIFGTFLGIVKGLPELQNMSISDLATTKKTMDMFLVEIATAMNSSIVGIFFSVVMTIFNTIFSPEKVFVQMIDRFESSLDVLWNRSDNNNYPKDLPEFDEHKDPVEALAEESVNSELSRAGRGRTLEEVRPGKAG